jgi:hypothetical protein
MRIANSSGVRIRGSFSVSNCPRFTERGEGLSHDHVALYGSVRYGITKVP